MNGLDWYLAFIYGVVSTLAVVTVWACVSLARQPRNLYAPSPETVAARRVHHARADASGRQVQR